MSVKSEQVPIESPCPIDLDKSHVRMGDRSMYCDHCAKDVHLLSEMSEPEARAFLADNEGKDICVSYKIGRDGKVKFKAPAPANNVVPIGALTRRRPPARALPAAASIAGALLLGACASHGEPERIAQDDNPVQVAAEEPQIPLEEPCDDDYMEVDGGIKAQPILDPEPLPMRGAMVAHPILDEPEPQPIEERHHIKRGKIKRVPDPLGER